ncbi:MAG: SIS domain-containing protein [Ardenticatenaceae bacterium]|nr:SIS domain-containing protein [Ardenticatenaceae bacterium]HBY97386.1 6-phospho-3-hexuloisomerase [Chloroflexota bacterium]
MNEEIQRILAELLPVVRQVSDDQVTRLALAIQDARRTFVMGEGRTGLIVRAFAARLAQLAFPAYVIGETTTPEVGAGDLLIAANGSGDFPITLLVAQQAQTVGARVAGLTAVAASSLAQVADLDVVLPGVVRGQPGSAQPFSALFQQVLWVYLDAVALRLAAEGNSPAPRRGQE